MNTNGKMISCEDCVYDNKFGSWHCVGCVAKSNFVPRSKSRIYYKSVQEMNQPPAAYLAMMEAVRGFVDDPIVPEILDVVFNGPATIIFWADGTKTVVKAIYRVTTSTSLRDGRTSTWRKRTSDALWRSSFMTISAKPWTG